MGLLCKPTFLARGGKLVYLVYLVHLVYLVCLDSPPMRKHTDILRALVPVLCPNDSRPKDAESNDRREVASFMAEDYAIDLRLVPT